MSRVLVVDDEADIAELLRIALEERGFEVTVAHDGLEAKTALEHDSADLALVISDIMMPFMDGRELVAWMRRQDPLRAVPVIVMSAVPPKTSIDEGWQAFVQKPFKLAKLVHAIDALLGSN